MESWTHAFLDVGVAANDILNYTFLTWPRFGRHRRTGALTGLPPPTALARPLALDPSDDRAFTLLCQENRKLLPKSEPMRR